MDVGGQARVENVCDQATVIAYNRQNWVASLVKGSKAVVVDRSGEHPVTHVAA
jgi:hypothetical protein